MPFRFRNLNISLFFQMIFARMGGEWVVRNFLRFQYRGRNIRRSVCVASTAGELWFKFNQYACKWVHSCQVHNFITFVCARSHFYDPKWYCHRFDKRTQKCILGVCICASAFAASSIILCMIRIKIVCCVKYFHVSNSEKDLVECPVVAVYIKLSHWPLLNIG